MMESFVRGFLRASLVWLGAGVALGLVMAIWPGPALALRPAHAHINLLGFVSMMIFGVAYHVVPRFTGNPLQSRRLPWFHLVAANLGLALLVAGWAGRVWPYAGAAAALGLGALLSAGGAYLFIYNLWRTLGRSARTAPAGPGANPPVGATLVHGRRQT
jgi:heme/copper-type cytochrome/quinol oxidase subunit 1